MYNLTILILIAFFYFMLPIKGFENYLITKDGLVVNKKTNRILKMSLQTTGYNQVCLSIKGVSKAFTVHRLVAENHIKNPNNYPCVNHINGIKTDNRVENLEWITYSDNHKHAFKLGLKKPPMYACKRVLNTENGIIYNSATEVAKLIGMKKQDLFNRLNGGALNQTCYVYL